MKKRLKRFLPYCLFVVVMAFSSMAWAQQKTISGTVVDDTGSPLPGVTVVVRGTTVGTITDVDGTYRLDVGPDDKILVFSYIGMLKQEVEITSQTMINVTLRPDVIGVGEVVVVGYGTRLKEELTGAVSSVSEDALQISTETKRC